MREALNCEELHFIRGHYCHINHNNNNITTFYSKLIEENILKVRDFVWVKLSSEDGTIEGCVMRQKWKNLRRRNLTYQIGNTVKKLSDLIVSVDFQPHNCDYSKPIQFHLLIPQ